MCTSPSPGAGRPPGVPGSSSGSLAAALWLLACGLPGALLGVEPAAIMPVEEIVPGLRGQGLSVFSGTEPEPFEVEVLGVMRNVTPETSYILARLSGQGLEESGVVAGMSGSPVYLEGRLAGAVAFSWIFSKEAVAGITPIAAMQRLSGGGTPGGAGPAAPPPSLADLVRPPGRDPGRELGRHLALLHPSLAGGARSAILWGTAGLGEETQALLRRSLAGVAPAGEAPGGTPSGLAPGSAVAGILVAGDLRIAAVGTVTDRRGEEVLAFGHSFLGVGPTRIPMAPAEVVTVIPSQLSSFKIANFGSVVGAFDLDRLPGVRGRIGLEAPMIPMKVVVRGPEERRFDLRLADIPLLTPILAAVSTLGSLEAVTHVAGSQGIDVRARYSLERYGELELRQSFSGQQAALESAIYVLTLTGFLVHNHLEEVRLSSIEIELTQSPEPRGAELVGAHASRTLVRPGERVAVNADFVAYRGEPFRRSLELELPTGLPAGRYSLLVGDGMSIDAARLAIERARPVTFGQALKILRSFHSRRQLVLLGLFGGPGLAVGGEVLPQLPGSLRSLWAAAASGGAVPLGLTIAQERAEWLDVPAAGVVRIDLEVRRREPLAAEGEEEEEADEDEEGAGEPGAEGAAEGTAAEAASGRGDGGRR